MSEARQHRSGGSWEVESNRRNMAIWLAVVCAYGAVGVGLLVLASHQHGVVHYLLGAVGVLGIAVACLAVGMLLLWLLGWGVVSGTFRERPTPVQWLWWGAAAVIAGGWLVRVIT